MEMSMELWGTYQLNLIPQEEVGIQESLPIPLIHVWILTGPDLYSQSELP